MDWGTELWDQFENVDKHLGHGIDFGEKYSKFVKERCSIEQDYASKLRKLVKSYTPRKRDEDRSMFSLQKAFQSQISELNDIAGQHELVAEEMMGKVSKVASNFSNELKSEKKKHYQDGRHLQVILDQHERSMEQTKKKFEKEWKDCERTQQYYEKLDSDSNVTKADVEKAKHIWHSKKDTVESCKTDYGASLQQFNTEQSQHYTTALPKVFEKFKEMDQKRILTLKDLMVEYAKIDLKVKPIIEKCLDGMVVAANAIDPNLDCNLVVEKMKSGFQPPGDKEFEDFSQPHQHRSHIEDGGIEGSPRNSANIGRQQNRKSGLSWLFGPKKFKQPRLLRKRLGLPSAIHKSASDTDISKIDKKSAATNSDEGPTISEGLNVEQKSRTLSFGANFRNHVNFSRRKSASGQEPKTKKNRSPIRSTVVMNKKRFKSLFKTQHKTDSFVAVEVSSPITTDLVGTADSPADDYLVPISPPLNPTPADENPYSEVAPSVPSPEPPVAESPDYSHLPPEQRKKKLQKAIDELSKELSKEDDGRKAIKKMQDVYKTNPALGDASSLDPQLKISNAKIDKLQSDLDQHEAWYADASGSMHSSPARASVKPQSVKTQPLTTPDQQSAREPLQRDQSFNDDFEDETLDAIGTCTALYDFKANSEGALSMNVGDKLDVVELDNGDGWTHVALNGDGGYVPTSYIELNLYP